MKAGQWVRIMWDSEEGELIYLPVGVAESLLMEGLAQPAAAPAGVEVAAMRHEKPDPLGPTWRRSA
jgi:hypothetical protein